MRVGHNGEVAVEGGTEGRGRGEGRGVVCTGTVWCRSWNVLCDIYTICKSVPADSKEILA